MHKLQTKTFCDQIEGNSKQLPVFQVANFRVVYGKTMQAVLDKTLMRVHLPDILTWSC